MNVKKTYIYFTLIGYSLYRSLHSLCIDTESLQNLRPWQLEPLEILVAWMR